jgi:pyruvate/2-oxoglutarate dehydrogenase complex dihydrolipoamide acyltransferase (E2) component
VIDGALPRGALDEPLDPPVEELDQIAIRPVMNFSFCFDHRVIDGATCRGAGTRSPQ